MSEPAALKLRRFHVGWDEKAEGVLMPDSKYDPPSQTFKTWDEMLAPLSVFEAEALGRKEGERYMNAMNGGRS